MRNASGYSLIEVVMALAVLAVLSQGVSTFLVQIHQSEKRFDAQVRINEAYLTLSEIITNPQRCEKAIGGGFDPAAPKPGLDFDEVKGIPSLSFRDPESPDPSKPRELYAPFSGAVVTPQGGDLAVPASAELAHRLVIRTLNFDKVQTVGTDRDDRYLDSSGSPVPIVRRTVTTDFNFWAEDLSTNPIAIQPKAYRVVLEIEREQSGTAWRIRQCAAPTSRGSQLGWTPDLVASTDCSTITVDPNKPFECPTGMYVVSQTYTPVSAINQLVACGCGKYGCGFCGDGTTTLVQQYTCCPSVK